MGGVTETRLLGVSFPGLEAGEAVITNTLDSPAGQRALFYIHVPFPTSRELFTVSAPNKQITGPSQCVLSEERREEGMKGLAQRFPLRWTFGEGGVSINSLHHCTCVFLR